MERSKMEKVESSSSEVNTEKTKTRKSSLEHEQIRYDGKMKWYLYLLQFEHITKKYKWSGEDKLDKLIECLRDKVLKFFSTRSNTVQNDYQALCKKMEERFVTCYQTTA